MQPPTVTWQPSGLICELQLVSTEETDNLTHTHHYNLNEGNLVETYDSNLQPKEPEKKNDFANINRVVPKTQ